MRQKRGSVYEVGSCLEAALKASQLLGPAGNSNLGRALSPRPWCALRPQPRAAHAARSREPPPGVTLHVLRALRSDRWDHDTLALLRDAAAATSQPAAVRGSTHYHELPDAGHWVRLLLPASHALRVAPACLRRAGLSTWPGPVHLTIKCMPAVGQVHADNPKGLVQLMLPSLVDAARQ